MWKSLQLKVLIDVQTMLATTFWYHTFIDLISFSGLDVGDHLPENPLELEKQIEEMNKQIEVQKSVINSISKNIVSASSEIGPTALANIALPSNLQQILDSIKTISTDGNPEVSFNHFCEVAW